MKTTEAGAATLTTDPNVLIMGAGPAGLTAAYELSRNDVPSVVLEAGFHRRRDRANGEL